VIAAYESEADQIEALKKLWKEYGIPAIIGLVIGIVILYGWRYYQSYQVAVNQAAATQYQVLWDTVDARQDPDAPLAELRKKYPKSVYSLLGSLLVARQAVADQKLDVAQQQLQWALDHSQKNILQDIIKVRYARVLIEMGKSQEALKLLENLATPSYASMRDQIKGDAYFKLNDLQKARKSYESALNNASLPEENRRLLQMKLADITTGRVS
jgi:predicted negative regulator of RcsB-dependent stress response